MQMDSMDVYISLSNVNGITMASNMGLTVHRSYLELSGVFCSDLLLAHELRMTCTTMIISNISYSLCLNHTGLVPEKITIFLVCFSLCYEGDIEVLYICELECTLR